MSVTMPDSAEMLEMIELLIGEDSGFAVGAGWDLESPPPGATITFLQKRDNTVACAVVTDLPAALTLGGKLIMVPEDNLREQLEAGQASESVMEAMGEVVSNLRLLFNNLGTNPPLAPTKTFPYQVPQPDDFVGWILNPSVRIDYTGTTAWGPATLMFLVP